MICSFPLSFVCLNHINLLETSLQPKFTTGCSFAVDINLQCASVCVHACTLICVSLYAFLFAPIYFWFSTNTGRTIEELPNSKRKCLRPGKVSPHRPVPAHIPRPPYVNSKKPPGFASRPEVHDNKGIECMKASGKLAAQVLQYAGTLIKVNFWSFRPLHRCPINFRHSF